MMQMNRTFTYCNGNVNLKTHFRKQFSIIFKIGNLLTLDLTILLFTYIRLKKLCRGMQKDKLKYLHGNIVIAEWKQPQCLVVKEQICK